MRRFYANIANESTFTLATPSIVFQHSMGKLEVFTRLFNYAGVTKSHFELVCGHPKSSNVHWFQVNSHVLFYSNFYRYLNWNVFRGWREQAKAILDEALLLWGRKKSTDPGVSLGWMGEEAQQFITKWQRHSGLEFSINSSVNFNKIFLPRLRKFVYKVRTKFGRMLFQLTAFLCKPILIRKCPVYVKKTCSGLKSQLEHHSPSQPNLCEPTFYTFPYKIWATVYIRNKKLAS